MSAAEKEESPMPDNINDKCVCCGKDTGIPRNTPVSERSWYISGSGQLCGECYLDLYVRQAEDSSRMTTEEMNELIKLLKNR